MIYVVPASPLRWYVVPSWRPSELLGLLQILPGK
jgi:hypothetical protein